MNEPSFISNPPSDDAIKLANAVYQTYIVEEYSHLKLSVERLCAIYAFKHTPETILYFKTLFAELNEPVALKDFTYEDHYYKWIVLNFCTFEKEWKNEDKFVYIALNEIYLSAMQKLMEEPFILFKD